MHTKLWGLKVTRAPTFGISGLPFGSPEQNVIWMWASWRGTKYTIRGKVMASPKSGPWWILWIRVCPWLVLTPKELQPCINYLVFGFVRVHVSSWCLSFFLVPSRSSSTPLYPQSVVNQGACPNSMLFHCFQFRLTFESIKELGSASQYLTIMIIPILQFCFEFCSFSKAPYRLWTNLSFSFMIYLFFISKSKSLRKILVIYT
jgi:hypothetical protein